MATLTVNIDKPPIPTGNTLWVDAVNGDDDTAVSGRQDKPYETLEAARDAAVSGDLIRVRPGTYSTATSLAKNGVHWYGEAGATITMNSTGGENGIFYSTGAVSYKVTGYFVIEHTVSGQAAEVHAAVFVNNNDAEVYIQCHSIFVISQTDTFDGLYGVSGVRGSLTVDVAEIISLKGVFGQTAVYWGDGPMYVRCPLITSDFTAVESYSGNSGEFFVEAQLIESYSATVITSIMGDASMRTWIHAQEVVNRGGGQALSLGGAGKFYLVSEKIEGGGTAAITSSGGVGGPVEAWITTQKFSSSSVFLRAFGHGIIHLTAQQYEDLGGMTTGFLIEPSSGDNDDPVIYLDGGVMVLQDADGIDLSGGSIRAFGLLINTSATDSKNPVVKSGGTLNLSGCTLIAEATQESISAPIAQAIIAEGCNTIYQPVHTNVTVRGNMQLDNGIAATGNVQIANPDGTWTWGPKAVQVTGLTLLDTGWTLVGGLYEYDLADANILVTSIVEVIPDNADRAIVQAAVFLPRTDSSAGSVKVYATNEPTDDIGVTINIYNQ
jgi:hypothetical protein